MLLSSKMDAQTSPRPKSPSAEETPGSASLDPTLTPRVVVNEKDTVTSDIPCEGSAANERGDGSKEEVRSSDLRTLLVT